MKTDPYAARDVLKVRAVLASFLLYDRWLPGRGMRPHQIMAVCRPVMTLLFTPERAARGYSSMPLHIAQTCHVLVKQGLLDHRPVDATYVPKGGPHAGKVLPFHTNAFWPTEAGLVQGLSIIDWTGMKDMRGSGRRRIYKAASFGIVPKEFIAAIAYDRDQTVLAHECRRYSPWDF